MSFLLRTWILLFAVLNLFPQLGAAPAKQEIKLEKLTAEPAVFLGRPPQTVARRIPGLVWRDANKTALYLPSRMLKSFRFKEYPVYDLLLPVVNGKIAGMQITVYTRGDAGSWRKSQCRDAVDSLADDFEKQLSARPRRRSGKFNNARVSVYRFNGKSAAAEIVVVSGRGDDPERLSVNFIPPGTPGIRFRDAVRTTLNTTSLPSKVQHRGNEHFIIVPMIDQGPKGYCVPATVGRVLLHFGSDIDQHTLARLLGAEAQSGTNINKAIDVLKDVRGRLNVDFRNKYNWEDLFDLRKRGSFIRRYNRIARKNKLPKLDNSSRQMPDFDYDCFRKLRLARPMRDFFPYVKSCIDRGIPIMWSILVFPQDRSAGGNGKTISLHLRLITGYATGPDRIIYSDSWGSGHEKKIMSKDDAMAITLRLFTLEPKK